MKTAVEKLIEKMSLEDVCKYSNELAEAKEMEKEQTMNAMDWIMNKYFEFHEQPTTSAREQYHNETFKSE
jgi:hypothetical protein